MTKIKPFALFLFPCFLLGCQDLEEKEDSLVYFFTDQDGSKVPLKEQVPSEEGGEIDSSEESQGYITRAPSEETKAKGDKKEGGFFSFFGKKEKEEDAELPAEEPSVPETTVPSVASKSQSTAKIEMSPISTSGQLDYPSIVTPKEKPAVQEAPLAKAYKILDLGEEKIRVIDRGMGSVEATDVKKLRQQAAD